jgi:hypothetical protein
MPMCNRCDEIDARIERYQKLKQGFIDEQTLKAIEALMKKLQTEKRDLHAE